LQSRWFFVPGVIGSLTLVLVTTLTAFAAVREREIGMLEQIMVTPIRASEFIFGKTLPFFLIGLLDVSLIAAVGTFWFHIPFRGNILVLLTGSVLFLLCMLGVGLLISTVSYTAASHGNVVLLHPACHHLLRLRIPHLHHAAMAAIHNL
jgi:ABC-2 type transport system permease protein